MKFAHKSVLLNECIEALNVKSDGIYVDCTAGGGGHSSEILKRLDGGMLVDIDKDEEALAACRKRLGNSVKYVHSDFKKISEILDELNIDKVDGILADLGVSSYQIDNPERGFSYMAPNAPLDMKMDATQKLSAYEVVNEYDEYKLFSIIRDYGEEKFAKQIARNIVLERKINKIDTCGKLVEIIDRSIPYSLKDRKSNV